MTLSYDDGETVTPVDQLPGWHTHPECPDAKGRPLAHLHGHDKQPDHTHLPVIAYGEKQDWPDRNYRPRQEVVPVVAYEYRCAACHEPLLEPEFESPFWVRPEAGMDAPNVTDYGGEGDVYELVEGHHIPIEGFKGGSETPLDVVVHAYRPDGKPACWHWCMYEEVQRIGPAEDCPQKDQHED